MLFIQIKNKNTIHNSSADELSMTNKQVNCSEGLKIAREKHNMGEDPVPYLKSMLCTYNCHTQWKIVAQICSYTVLFSDDLKIGVEYFMLLVEADQNGMINKDLILVRISNCFIYHFIYLNFLLKLRRYFYTMYKLQANG